MRVTDQLSHLQGATELHQQTNLLVEHSSAPATSLLNIWRLISFVIFIFGRREFVASWFNYPIMQVRNIPGKINPWTRIRPHGSVQVQGSLINPLDRLSAAKSNSAPPTISAISVDAKADNSFLSRLVYSDNPSLCLYRLSKYFLNPYLPLLFILHDYCRSKDYQWKFQPVVQPGPYLLDIYIYP